MIKAIAFDPGKTTGFATGEIGYEEEIITEPTERPLIEVVKERRILEYYPMEVQTAEAQFTHADIMNYLNDFKPDYIICERFDFRNRARTGLELISREFIGVINLYVQLNVDCKLVMQSASQGKGHFTDEKLKRSGIYRKGWGHANDAARHLLQWYKFGSGHQYGTEFKLKE